MSKHNIVDISDHRPTTVYLMSYGQHKVQAIKVIKDEFDLGLADTKNLVESAPCEVGTFASKAAAERFKAMLDGVGANAELR